MRRGLRNVSLVGLVLALLLLLGMQVGWISPPAFLRGDAQDASPDPAIEEPTDPREVNPTLRGRTPSDVLEDDWDVLPSPVDLDAVDREHDLHGIVVRQDGTPVAGASLQVLTHPWRHQDLLMDHGQWDVNAGPLTRSAADGTFRLGLERGEPVALYARAKGLAPVEMHLLQAGERIRVVLQEPARIRVVVRGPDGEPVEGTSVRLFHRGGRGHQARGVTDAEGVLLLAELEAERSGWIDVTPPRFGYPGWVNVETPAAGEETTVEVDLTEGRTLRGRVTDATTGEGIAEARVGMNWVLRPKVKTDASGAYELGGWTGIGVRDIHVLAEGYAREAKVVGAENEIDFVLLPVPPVLGRVVDEGGRAVEGARVHAIGTEGGAGGSRLSVDDAQTGADGRFRLTGLTPGLPHMLVVVALGYGRTWRPFAVVDGEEEALDLGDVVLPSGLSLSGVVVDAEDVPLARAALELIHGEEEFRSTRGATLDRVTDDLGRFFFHDLSSGTYTLRVKPTGGVEASRVVVLEDGDASDMRVVIAADVEIVVLVLDESGAPVPEAYVSFVGTGRRHAQAQSDADGRAVAKLPVDRVGEYTVTVRTFDRSDLLPGTPRSLRVDEREIEVVLRTALTIRGRLLTDEGTPVPSVPLSLRRGDDTVAWTRTEADGSYSFSVEPGPPVDVVFDGRMSGNLETRWRDFGGRREGVLVGADDVLVTVHAVASDRFVEVQVLDPDGNPAAGVTVLVPGATMSMGVPLARTDDSGTCRIEDLQDEEIRLKVVHTHTEEAPWAAPPEVAVVPDGQIVVLRMRRARLLEGRVTWAAATAPVWVTIRLQRADGTLVSEGGGRDGAFRVAVPLDEEGPLVLRAEGRAPDGSTMVGRRAVPPPEATDVTVELRTP